jgi:hypothetical protein
VKAFRIWLGRLFWFLYLVLVLANPVSDILRSADPLGAAIAYLIPVLVMLAIWAALALWLGLVQARMPAPAFEAVNYALAAVALFVVLVIWRATERFGGHEGLIDDSWTAIVAISRMDNPVLVVAGLAAPVAGLFGLGGVLYGGARWAERRLAGDARLAAYLGLAALAAFGVLVVMPAMANHANGKPFVDANLVWGLLLWLGMVVPAAGVLLAYRRIGDGRS